MLGAFGEIIGHRFDTVDLDKEVEEYEARVAEAVEESSDFLEYVRELEENNLDIQSITPADSEQLVEEIERFLQEPNAPG